MSDKPLPAYVDFSPEENKWIVTCSECEWWIETYDSSGKATDAADWHDVEVHNVLGDA